MGNLNSTLLRNIDTSTAHIIKDRYLYYKKIILKNGTEILVKEEVNRNQIVKLVIFKNRFTTFNKGKKGGKILIIDQN